MIRTTRSPGIISVSHTEKDVSSHNNDDESQLLALQKGISKRPSETDSQIENDSKMLKGIFTDLNCHSCFNNNGCNVPYIF